MRAMVKHVTGSATVVVDTLSPLTLSSHSTVGCDQCDGTTNHVGHGGQSFLFKGTDSTALRQNNITIPNPFTPSPGDLLCTPEQPKGNHLCQQLAEYQHPGQALGRVWLG